MSEWSEKAVPKYQDDLKAYRAQTESSNRHADLKRTGGLQLWNDFKSAIAKECAEFNTGMNARILEFLPEPFGFAVVGHFEPRDSKITSSYDEKSSQMRWKLDADPADHKYGVSVEDGQVQFSEGHKAFNAESMTQTVLSCLLERQRPKK